MPASLSSNRLRLCGALVATLCAGAAWADASRDDTGSGPIALVIHGGAGVIERDALSADDEREIRAALDQALDAGQGILGAGGSALDAVEATVRVLEESPRFNAGHGAVFNADGGHELDASVMEGHTRRAGAVAGVTTVRNPVRLARRVMDASPHVMLIGDGAERFADAHDDLERVPNAWFGTPQRREQLDRARAREAAQRQARHGRDADAPDAYFGTVGAVALDRDGRIAAATSTGGMTNKRYGRVGDAPIIGAGTWADAGCGVSATGWGEFFIRNAVAHDICARVAYRGDSLQTAADEVVMRVIPEHGGDGGVIALDAQGHLALPFNTSGMYRGWLAPDGSRGTAIFADE
ncbi:isoaspartyl peptidase/L-asparaginase family protein [Luteimonas abyssi]|uniref:isoaspartyl peptidase/L-asparaginase family protein n=1 Tax=Luteimonas abyssi TaxID=1247514 RepID=UPI0009E7392A|nr:isoaspartyl peptidase/L-asparaginase [Luteimonas abyssi]